jgi:hypothetical protein
MNSERGSLIALAEFLEKFNVSDFGLVILEAGFAIEGAGRKGFQVLGVDVCQPFANSRIHGISRGVRVKGLTSPTGPGNDPAY